MGTVEAIVNKLGGMEGVQLFLSGRSTVKIAIDWELAGRPSLIILNGLGARIKSVPVWGLGFEKSTQAQKMVERAKILGLDICQNMDEVNAIASRLREFKCKTPILHNNKGELRVYEIDGEGSSDGPVGQDPIENDDYFVFIERSQ